MSTRPLAARGRTAPSLAALGLAALTLVACTKKQEITAPPPPLRPEPAAAADTSKKQQKDCEIITSDMEEKPMAFDQRAITESAKLADEAKANLKLAQSAEIERIRQEEYTTKAVTDLITALRSDPYNVSATYTLAKAYARIGRPNCTMYLLTRLLQMRTHPSKRPTVEAQIDMLLGRNRQPLDPDFADMRRNDNFRELIKKMCEGTNDPGCVFGTSK
jgi:hypothetical protein